MRDFQSLFCGVVCAAIGMSRAGAEELFVAVGQNGRYASSLDGVHWESDPRWTGGVDLLGIVFGAGRFVAVGGDADEGCIVSSTDGREWHEVFRSDTSVAAVAFGQTATGDARFVAASGAGLLHSRDGAHFTTGAKLDWPGAVSPRRVAFGDTEAGRRFVIIGSAVFPGEIEPVPWRAATADGASFLHVKDHTAPADDIAHGAGRFVVVGPRGLIESSHDGQTWVRQELPLAGDVTRVLWTGVRFIASGASVAWSSHDGITWTAESWSIPGSLVWAREDDTTARCLAQGAGGAIQRSTKHGVWHAVAVPTTFQLNAIAWRAR